jgi:hypothetical protein
MEWWHKGSRDPSVTLFTLSTAEELAGLASLVNRGEDFYGKTVLLARDIDLSVHYDEDYKKDSANQGWVPIGKESSPFKGVFDGGGHKIVGLYIHRPSAGHQGLFGHIQDGRDENIGVEDADVTAGSEVGGVAGYVVGDVRNCYSLGSVAGEYYIGGVVGRIVGNVRNCYSFGTVTGKANLGGVASYVNGRVRNCYSAAAVTATNSRYLDMNNVGGVVGLVDGGEVTNCYSAGIIKTMIGDVGGVVGHAQRSSVTSCVALNPSVYNQKSAVKLVVGRSGRNRVANNRVLDGMSMTKGGATNPPFWTTALDWGDDIWDSADWSFEDGELPMLKKAGGDQAGQMKLLRLPPTPGGGGEMTVSNATAISLTLNWTAASDNTPAESLKYSVYHSCPGKDEARFQLETVTGVTKDSLAYKIKDLEPDTTYRFGVTVENARGLLSEYAAKTWKTTPIPVITIETQPKEKIVVREDNSNMPLSVTATVTENADLRYVWYLEGVLYPQRGERTRATNVYHLPTWLEVGTYKVWCNISTTDEVASITTNVTEVIVKHPLYKTAAFPVLLALSILLFVVHYHVPLNRKFQTIKKRFSR